MRHTYTVAGKLRRFPGAGGWHYVALSKDLAAELREKYRPIHGGWGSLRVAVHLGTSKWRTSIFWNKEVSYWLFIKAEVRQREHLRDGSLVRATVTLLGV